METVQTRGTEKEVEMAFKIGDKVYDKSAPKYYELVITGIMTPDKFTYLDCLTYICSTEELITSHTEDELHIANIKSKWKTFRNTKWRSK